MKKTSAIAAYIFMMGLLVTAVLVLAKHSNHKDCPVCNHSFVKEGIKKSPLVTKSIK